jgi:integrase
MRLTDITVRNLPVPSSGQKVHYDDALPNFGCRLSQGGTRTFIVRLGVDRQLVTIGRYPVISLADARTEAKRLLAERTLGKHRPRTMRWDDALKLYLAACAEKNRTRTVEGYRRLLNRHFRFRRQQLSEITSDDIERKLGQITAPAERNHALVAVKTFLAWCQKPPRRYIVHNPCEGMVPTKQKSRKRVLSDQELAAVYRAAIEGTDTFSSIVALLLLNGQRRLETASLDRSWFNTVERTITLPDWLTKNKQQHTFPYAEATEEILEHIPHRGNLLFPATRERVRGKPCTIYAGWAKDKKAFDKRCGVYGWTLHDLRRTFGTGLAQLGVLPHVVERLLNHRLGSITNKTEGVLTAVAEVYNTYAYMPEMRDAIARWENHLAFLIGSIRKRDDRFRPRNDFDRRRDLSLSPAASDSGTLCTSLVRTAVLTKSTRP